MKSIFFLTAFLVTSFLAGVAVATPIDSDAITEAKINVEYWGRERLVSENPDAGGPDIITYGAPVDGSFGIWLADAPSTATRPSTHPDSANAATYGRDTTPVGNPDLASFVTSDRVTQFPDSVASDHVTIGDGLTFLHDRDVRDWFEVSDTYTEVPLTGREFRHELFVSVTTPLDIIDGIGLDQEFDLVNPVENGGSGGGFFRSRVEGAIQLMSFIVDRLRVTKQLGCRKP